MTPLAAASGDATASREAARGEGEGGPRREQLKLVAGEEAKAAKADQRCEDAAMD